MKRRTSVILAGVCVLAATAYGTTRAVGQGYSAALAMGGAPPVAAALVTATFGWVLTPDELLVTRDAGATFEPTKVPLPAGSAGAAAYFRSAQDGVVAGLSDGTIVVARTTDGARTWSTGTVARPADNVVGYSTLSMSFDLDGHGAILARVATGQAFSMGTLFVTADGGTTWSAHRAPEAGAVSVGSDKRIWVAGTGLHATSDDGESWTTPTLRLTATNAAITVAPPIGDTVAVTVTDGSASAVELLGTSDGRTWTSRGRVAVHAHVGGRVRIPVSATAGGLLVFDTTGGHVYRARDAVDIGATGLPDGVGTITFPAGGAAGWALATYGTCRRGKQDCILHHDLVATTDLAATWHPVAVWNKAVG